MKKNGNMHVFGRVKLNPVQKPQSKNSEAEEEVKEDRAAGRRDQI